MRFDPLSPMEAAHGLIDLHTEGHRQEAIEFCASGFIGLRRLFWSWPIVQDFTKALPGVSDETLCRMADMPARTIVDGKHMVSILFCDPAHGWNIVAWCIKSPEEWYVWRDDEQFILGRENIEANLFSGTMPPMFDTPLAWLQNSMRGIVLL